MDNRQAVGLALGVIEADGSIAIVTAGDPGVGARPLSERSVFEIGSITKVFTTTLLARMVRSGEVALYGSGVSVPARRRTGTLPRWTENHTS